MKWFKHGMQDTSQEFWKWFVKNEQRIFEFEREQEGIFDELHQQLKKVNKDLCFEFSGKEDGKREFVISAGGIKTSFPAVISLKDGAPDLSRFKVIAFRQRHPGFTVRMGDVNIEEKDVYASTELDGEKVGVLVLMKGVEGASDDKKAILKQIMYLFLDGALGEYDVETRLSWIELGDLDTHKHLSMVSITKLAEIIDQTKSATS